MVGCGGFGPANTGVMIIVRAAAKEPAIVALAMMLFEFIGVILSRNGGRCGAEGTNTPSRAVGAPANPATRRLHSKAGSGYHTRHAVVIDVDHVVTIV